jgi:carbon storage regulator
MLVLSRRPGDAILIDGGIRIVVLACDHRGVRIGIEAPAKIGIVREEIVTQIAVENKRATNVDAARAWLNRKQQQG